MDTIINLALILGLIFLVSDFLTEGDLMRFILL